MENSIEEDIKIAVDKFSDNKDIDSAMLIVEKFILGNYILLGGNRGNIVKDSLRYILLDYKRVLKENESLQKTYDDCYCKYKHYKQFESISIQKVKDKIEEYDKQRIKMEKDDIGVGFTLGKEWSDLKAKIEALQELLEGGD